MREATGSPEPAAESKAETPDRLVFFSDAVAAIALTLLALDLPVPRGTSDRELWHDLGAHWHSDFLPFLLTFLVIAAFWNAHRELFRHVDRLGAAALVPVNFVFLLMIVLLPFVTRVIGEDGDFQVGVVLYAATIVITAVALAVEATIIRRNGLHHPGRERELSDFVTGMVALAIVFAASIPFGFLIPSFTTWLWLILGVAVRLAARAIRQIQKARHPET